MTTFFIYIADSVDNLKSSYLHQSDVTVVYHKQDDTFTFIKTRYYKHSFEPVTVDFKTFIREISTLHSPDDELSIYCYNPSLYYEFAERIAQNKLNWKIGYAFLHEGAKNSMREAIKEQNKVSQQLKEIKDNISKIKSPNPTKTYYLIFWDKEKKELGSQVIDTDPFVWEGNNFNQKTLLNYVEMTEENKKNYIPF